MTDSIFFQGSLQDGISLAIQQSKMVLAFVTDDGDESRLWESELLTNESLKAPLENQAVALRLVAGSEEAGFLEALFPIPKKPTVVVIRNGTLQEYIQGGTAKEELVRRIAAILGSTSASHNQQTMAAPIGQTPSEPPPAPQVPESTVDNSLDDLYDDYDIPARPSAAPARPSQQERSSQEQSSQKAERLEAEKKAKEAERKAKEVKEAKEAKESKAKAEREARVKGKQKATGSNESQPADANTPERTYAEEVRHRKIQASEERKRILKRIEDDRRERKEREAEERQARLLLSASNDAEASSNQTPAIPLARKQTSGSSRGGDHCNLQVRLFDGSTIRSRFKSDATLNNEVRKWIDEERTDGDAPYTFRIVLTPLPNKAIAPSEESQTLLSLDLAPSATLVLVPARHVSAYAGAAATGGFIWRGFSYVMGVFGTWYGFLAAMLGGFTGALTGRGARPPPGDNIHLRNLAPGGTASRIRGFRNSEDERRDPQLYNGNSLNFEPRRDDDEGDDENR